MLVWGATSFLSSVSEEPGPLRDSRDTTNQEAFMAYQRGRSLANRMDRRTLRNAIDEFSTAIQFDPNHASAYAGLVECYMWGYEYLAGTTLSNLHFTAQKLLQLDPSSAEAHTAIGFSSLLECKWASSESAFKRAIELNDGYAAAHLFYGWWLICQDRLDEAGREFSRAEQLEPAFVITRMTVGWPFHAKGRYGEAIACYQKALDLEPNNFHARYWLLRAREAQGEFLEAIAESEAAEQALGISAEETAVRHDRVREAFRERGPRGYWEASLARTLAGSAPGF
jgi:Tfp pilus assembly protein PilF